jgi:UDP-N-acetylmuramoylalanine--D-glutamate ligase
MPSAEYVLSDWSGKRVTILGLGRSGTSTATYLKKRGAAVLISEKSELAGERTAEADALRAKGIEVEAGGHSEAAIASADLIVVSPGIPPSSEVIQRAAALNKEVICDIELAYRDRGRTEIVAITGTNGKSTTCALTSHVLEQCGLTAPACGNFGIPILGQLESNPDYLVAEVSSYQLHYCPTFAPMIGVWLNLTPDHLEWHGGLEQYIEAKAKMFLNQRADQYAVLNQDDRIVARFEPPSEIFPFAVQTDINDAVQGAFMEDDFLCYRIDGATKVLCGRDELKIIGDHNLENALASLAVAAILRLDKAKVEAALKSFRALEHRLEFVETLNGVEFFNDSKATNPTSTIKALEAFGSKRIVLIAGGRDKGTPLDELVNSAKEHVSEVILLGEAKQRFEEAFRAGGFAKLHAVNTLEEAVDLGASLRKGPVVLSPACASFDMFKDYEERGRVFKNLVRARLEKMARSR